MTHRVWETMTNAKSRPRVNAEFRSSYQTDLMDLTFIPRNLNTRRDSINRLSCSLFALSTKTRTSVGGNATNLFFQRTCRTE